MGCRKVKGEQEGEGGQPLPGRQGEVRGGRREGGGGSVAGDGGGGGWRAGVSGPGEEPQQEQFSCAFPWWCGDLEEPGAGNVWSSLERMVGAYLLDILLGISYM